jgi:transcriptional regulator with XRE-family HTH domain
MSNSFGARLRWWRRRRGHSQLDLAGAAGTTQRHLSFLESGRAQPSREMVLRLAAALDVPLRQQNALLLAAVLAPEWPNVLMTPHVSGWTEGMLEARARLIANNIRRTAHGEPPLHGIAATV